MTNIKGPESTDRLFYENQSMDTQGVRLKDTTYKARALNVFF